MTLIEDSIIAYFDKRLSDAERADLLRQVSADPAHQKLFQQHEALRGRMLRAQSNVSVSPVLEDHLLTRISALQRHAAPQIPRLSALSRMPIGAFATMLVAVISTLYLVAPNPSTVRDQSQREHRTTSANKSSAQPTAQFGVDGHGSFDLKTSIRPGASVVKGKKLTSKGEKILADKSAIATSLSNASSSTEAPQSEAIISNVGAPVQTRSASDSLSQALRSYSVEHFNYASRESAAPRFDFMMEGTDGTVYPTGLHHLWDFSGVRLSVGYFLSASNVVGLRVSGLRVRTQSPAVMGVFVRPDSGQMTTRMAGEIYLEHREMLLAGRLIVTGALSGGLIQQGNLLSAELGLRIPFTEHLMASATYSVSRTHSSAPGSYFDVVHNTIETRNPNSVNSRLLYGLSYQF